MMVPGGFMASVDLKKGHRQTPIHPSARPFLAFVHDGSASQYRVTPFRLSLACAYFSSLIAIIPDILCNAGGVTVSYFEWLKNLQHVRFGRMTKQWEERNHKWILSQFEELKDNVVTPEDRELFIKGPSEVLLFLLPVSLLFLFTALFEPHRKTSCTRVWRTP